MGKNISGKEIKKMCEEGNEDGWKILYKITLTAVCKHAQKYNFPIDLIQDIAQYSLLQTIRLDRMTLLKNPQALTGFIYRCAVNDLHSYARREKIWKNNPEDFDDFSLENKEGNQVLANPGLPYENNLLQWEDTHTLEKLCGLVKEKCGKYYPLLKDYILSKWKDGEDIRLRDLAVKYDMPLGSVKTTVERCFKKILYEPELKGIIDEDLVERFKKVVEKKQITVHGRKETTNEHE